MVIWKDLKISLSVLLLRNSSFSPITIWERNDLTLLLKSIKHLLVTSWQVLKCFPLFFDFLTFFTGWIFVVSLSFSCVRLNKKCCPNFRASRDLNFRMFFPWRMPGQTCNTHVWYIETFLTKTAICLPFIMHSFKPSRKSAIT